jgi:hypothetical protein
MARQDHFADRSARSAALRPDEGESLRRSETIDALIRLHRSQRAADTSEPLIWAGLGLILVLLFSMLLTTHWFPA